MTEDERWVRQVVGVADPLPGDEFSPLDERGVRRRLERRTGAARRAPVAVAAALLVVALAAASTLAPRPAWAVDELDDGRVRVELPEVWQRGPDPDGLVEELRAHDIDVELREGRTVVPWSLGGIIGTYFEFGGAAGDEGLPPDTSNPAGFERAAEAAGLEFLEQGGYLVDPDVFEGEIRLTVGVPPWDQPESSRPESTTAGGG